MSLSLSNAITTEYIYVEAKEEVHLKLTRWVIEKAHRNKVVGVCVDSTCMSEEKAPVLYSSAGCRKADRQTDQQEAGGKTKVLFLCINSTSEKKAERSVGNNLVFMSQALKNTYFVSSAL